MTIDLTGLTQIKYDIRASRTGENIKIGIHDAGGVTTEHTANILQANEWQTETWDISGVSDANKDAIDKMEVTIINADAENIFYIDNMYGEIIQGLNMTLVSKATEALAQPDEIRIVIMEEDVDDIALNTDIKAYATREGDNGETWAQATLTDKGDYESGKRILEGKANVAGQASDKTIKWKVTTHNGKDLKLYGVGLPWK